MTGSVSPEIFNMANTKILNFNINLINISFKNQKYESRRYDVFRSGIFCLPPHVIDINDQSERAHTHAHTQTGRQTSFF